MTTLKTATRTGYEHVWSGAINYLRGVWLQLSRGLLAFAWGILALMAAGRLNPHWSTLQYSYCCQYRQALL